MTPDSALPDSSQAAPRPIGSQPRSHRRLVIFFGGVVVLGALFAIVHARGAKAPSGSAAPSASAGNRPVTVLVAPVQTRDLPIYLDGLGNATPLATVTVKSQVDGR